MLVKWQYIDPLYRLCLLSTRVSHGYRLTDGCARVDRQAAVSAPCRKNSTYRGRVRNSQGRLKPSQHGDGCRGFSEEGARFDQGQKQNTFTHFDIDFCLLGIAELCETHSRLQGTQTRLVPHCSAQSCGNEPYPQAYRSAPVTARP